MDTFRQGETLGRHKSRPSDSLFFYEKSVNGTQHTSNHGDVQYIFVTLPK